MLVYRLLTNIIIQMPEYVKLCIYLRLPPRVVIYVYKRGVCDCGGNTLL